MDMYDAVRFHMVDICDIKADGDLPQRNANLEKLAEEILEVGMLVTPLIVREIGAMNYVLVSRKEEFVAAQIANEKDSNRILHGMVNCFVIKKDCPEKDTIQKMLLSQRKHSENLVK